MDCERAGTMPARFFVAETPANPLKLSGFC
jgi:hypothetical protein